MGSLITGGVALELVSEDCTAGFDGIKEASGVEAEGWVDGGWRGGMSTDGGEVEVGSDGETMGRCSEFGVVPCGPMLRAATSVVGMGCDSIAAFFGVLAGSLGEAFIIGRAMVRCASPWGGKSFSFRALQ